MSVVTTQTGVVATLPNGTKIVVVDDGSGNLTQVVHVDNFPGTQPVSATALPLPTGAATEATLANVAKDGTDISTPSPMPAGGVGIRGWLSAIYTKLMGSLAVTGTFWPATQPVSISAAVAVTGPATNTELRATPLPISGTVTVTDGSGPLTVDGTVGISGTVPVSIASNTPDVTDRVGRVLGVVSDANNDVARSTRLKPADTLAGVTAVGAITGALPAGTNLIGQAAVPPATLSVTAVSAANTAVTCTLPAAGAGLFHYISRIIIERVATTAVVGSAVLTYTSTNLPGSWARTSGNAAPVGQQMKDVDEVLGSEVKSSAANAATTIVAPAAGATAIVRITVYYRTGV